MTSGLCAFCFGDTQLVTAAERVPVATNDDPTTPMALPGDDASATAPVRLGDAAMSASREPSEMLPQPNVVLEREDGAELDKSTTPAHVRRLFAAADGLTTLERLAPIVGVNVVRAQHLAKELLAANKVRIVSALADELAPARPRPFELRALADLDD
jgi:hypothetical protein